jgi:hypothetical protein
MIRWFTAALVAAIFATGCAQTATEGAKLPAGEKLKMAQEAWAEYQDYLKRGERLGHKKSGAFAVVLHEGVGITGGGSWFYCPREYDGCRTQGGENATENILNVCRREGLDCMIFARNDTIQVPYELVD